MKVLKWIAIVLGALIGLLLVVGLVMPKEWKVERSAVVNEGPAKIHPHVGNLEGWPKWMPWIEEDPAMKITFEGTAGAPGSKMIWTSEKMGNGRLTVVKSDPAVGLDYELMMDEFEAPARGSIHDSAEGTATRLTWTDTGTMPSNPMLRAFGPLLEAYLGTFFDRGLAKVKGFAESSG